MNEVVAELSKPVWWISVVVAGLAINLVSAYLKPAIDERGSRLFSWWARRTAQSRAKQERRVKRASESEEAMTLEWRNEVRYRTQTIQHLVLAVLMLVTAVLLRIIYENRPAVEVVACWAIASLHLCAAAHNLIKATKHKQVQDEAEGLKL